MKRVRNIKVFSTPFSAAFGKAFGAEGLGVFSPEQIVDLLAWHDADDSDTIVISTGSQISQWTDKSGNANNLVQATSSDQPLTNTSTLGGLNVIDFDGVNDLLAKSGFVVSGNVTIFIVGNIASTTSDFNSILSFNASNDFQIESGSAGEFEGRFSSSNLGATAPPQGAGFVGTDFILAYRLSDNDSVVSIRRNRAPVNSDTYNGNLGASQNYRLATNRGASQFMPCVIGEVIIYDRDLSFVEIEEVEAYLANKWSIASVFSPERVADLLAWYDAADLGTILGDMIFPDEVTQWNDKSGNGFFLVQATSDQRPVTNIVKIGGLNVIDFDGVNDNLNQAALPLNNNMTVFIVGKVNSTALATDSVISFGGVNKFEIDASVIGEFRGRFNSSNLGATTPPEDSDFVGTEFILAYRLSDNDSTVEMRRNGRTKDSDTYVGNFPPANTLHVGENQGTNEFIPCEIGEMIFYNRDLTETEIDQIELYLSDKWSIALDPFSPADIANLLSWHDADDSGTIVIAGGNRVSAWNDKSGNGNNLLQTIMAQQPDTTTNTLGGLNVIAFDGVDDNLFKTSLTVSNNLTIFIVGTVISVNSNNDSILSFNATNDFQIEALTSGQFKGLVNTNNLGATTPVEDVDFLGTNFILVYRFSDNDSTLEMRRNGTAIASDTYNGNLNATQTYGLARNRGDSQFIECDLGEVIIYDSDLSPSEVDQVEEHLGIKWSITLP